MEKKLKQYWEHLHKFMKSGRINKVINKCF